MNTAIQFFGSTMGFIPLASPMEPETTRAILNYRPRPKVVDQLNIDGWVKDIKTASSLPHGSDNLGDVFDVVYLWGVNNLENARIDFVTGTKKATVKGSGVLNHHPWGGIYTSTLNNPTGMLTGWNINSAIHATPTNHHFHTSFLTSRKTSSTNLVMGLDNYSVAPLQTISGVDRFRILHGGGLTNFDNDDQMGAYVIKKEAETLVSYVKNDGPRVTGTRIHTGYSNVEFSALGRHNADGTIQPTLSGLVFGTFTAGRYDNIDSQLLNEATYNYFLKYGADLKLYTGGY